MEVTTWGSLSLRDAEGGGSELCNLPDWVSFLTLLLQRSLKERFAATTQELALVSWLGCPSCLFRFTLHLSLPCCRMHEVTSGDYINRFTFLVASRWAGQWSTSKRSERGEEWSKSTGSFSPSSLGPCIRLCVLGKLRQWLLWGKRSSLRLWILVTTPSILKWGTLPHWPGELHSSSCFLYTLSISLKRIPIQRVPI